VVGTVLAKLWANDSPMESFALIIWIWIGARFEETRIENLTREECVERQVEIQADRARAVYATCRGRV